MALSAIPAGASETPAGQVEEPSAYLMAHFTGETPIGEQIYFAVSKDGLNWTDLNGAQPALVSELGEKGVRDPSFVRSPDGATTYLLATDLRIASKKGWGAAMARGSTSIVVWESSNLVDWSAPRLVDIAGSIPGAGCAWAPEAIYDAEAGDYFVYWTTISPVNGDRRARIYCSRTKDFRSFTPAELYIARPGRDIIDTQILRGEGAKRRFYRVSCDGQITLEAADRLLGPWELLGDLSHLGYTNKQLEGPILFQFNNRRQWGLFLDQYSSGRGYLPFVSADLDDPRGFAVSDASGYNLGAARKRHGGILPVSLAEHDAIQARWPRIPVVRLSLLSQPQLLVRHYAYRLRADKDVHPAEDGRWLVFPGLDRGTDTLSLRSANFPDRYLAAASGGAELLRADGTPAFAAQASFVRVPGLASDRGVSLRLAASPDLFLKAAPEGVSVGPVATDADRRAATFTLDE